MMVISEELCSALCQQISHERYNSGFYLFISGFLKNKGLDALGDIFFNQSIEEDGHAQLIHKFLTDMSATVSIYEVNAVNLSLNSIMDVALKYLERESQTTKNLEEIKQLTSDDGDGISYEFLCEMVGKQRNEMAEALSFVDNAELCGNNWMNVKIWNDSLGGD